MFQSISLFKLDAATDASRADTATKLRAACVAKGFDAAVGTPADDASRKSWDLSLTVAFRTREQATAFDAAAELFEATGLASPAVVVQKGWVFDTAG